MLPKFEPEIYIDITSMSRRKNTKALQRTTFRRPPEDCRQVLDIGCGTGDFTRDVLLPWSHPCTKVVAVDASSAMVDYARANYGHPAICYDVLDLGAPDVSTFVEKYGRFDRIYSFFCLHWIRDQEAAFRNISWLLKDGGEALLVFSAQFVLYDVWMEMAAMERWKDILDDPTKLFPDTWQREPPPSVGELEMSVRNLVTKAGMVIVACDVSPKKYRYRNDEEVLALLATLVTVKSGTPKEKEDCMREELSSRLLGGCTRTATGCSFHSHLFTLHAQKASEN